MKKFFAFLAILLLLVSPCYALTDVRLVDPYGVMPTTTVATGDVAVKATPGYVHSVLYSYKGVTIGDTIDINDASAAGTTVKIRFTAPTANGTFLYNPPSPIPFPTTGIYCDMTISGGAINVVIQYS